MTVLDTVANRLRAVYDPNVTRHIFQVPPLALVARALISYVLVGLQAQSKVIPWMDFMVRLLDARSFFAVLSVCVQVEKPFWRTLL
jgi:hypothetical protein